jgi:hypothetical protein
MVLVADAAYAQGSIVGVVRDTSGAVLPGVTVEAASPALIEKVRSVVTDGTGQYQIVSLAAGTYSVTYTLPGFNTIKRDGIELTGSFTAKVDAEMRVGAVEETITVTGEAPVVDVQSPRQQRVVGREILDTIPVGRSAIDYAALIPGVSSSNRDVGGSAVLVHVIRTATVHGGGYQVILRNGVMQAGQAGNEQNTPANLNPSSAREVVVDTASTGAEYAQNGVRINVIPREGANTFSGVMFANYATSAMQSDNFSEKLKAAGLLQPNTFKHAHDLNPGFGGPLKQDKAWFYVSVRQYAFAAYTGGVFYNLNANNPNAWTYEPDLSRQAYNHSLQNDGQLRLTWQATEKNKIGISWQESPATFDPNETNAETSPDGSSIRTWPVQRQGQVDWSSPVTNRILFEAGGNFIRETSFIKDPPGLNPAMIRVVEQSTGLGYRAPEVNRPSPRFTVHLAGAASYITGTHQLKLGFHHTNGRNTMGNGLVNGQPVSYRFNNGVPNRITQTAFPIESTTKTRHNFGLYLQDKWTIQRLTATYGGRFDYYSGGWAEDHVGPAPLAPTRNLTFPAATSVTWKDLTPHLGAVYDLFGTGRTALKVSLKKGLEGVDARTNVVQGQAPINRLVNSTTRSWNDANRDFVPDCNLLNPAANGECGALADQNFGSSTLGATFDPDLVRGWGKRGYNWEFSAIVQQEIQARTSLDVGYFRRAFGNQRFTDNRANPLSAFDFFDLTAPVDPRLPGGGGYVIHGLYNLKPAFFGVPADGLVTLAENIGKQIERWQGVDLNINMRPGGGVLVQGGFSTGRTTTDTCDLLAKSPAPSNTNTQGLVSAGQITPLDFCHRDTPWLTQVKFIGSYTVPIVGIGISATFQDVPGPEILANYNLPTAVAAQVLGRPLSGGAANISVPIVRPGTIYGERNDQVDLRFSKRITVGRTRTTFNFDIYNAFNDNSVLAYNNNFAVWQRPTDIMLARFAKVGMQVDF